MHFPLYFFTGGNCSPRLEACQIFDRERNPQTHRLRDRVTSRAGPNSRHEGQPTRNTQIYVAGINPGRLRYRDFFQNDFFHNDIFHNDIFHNYIFHNMEKNDTFHL